jgi:hypothetical protein
MPNELSYLNKWHPPVRTNVGPLEYLFDLRPVNHKCRKSSLSIRPDSYTLELSLLLTDSPLYAYHEAVENNSFHFPIKEDPSTVQISQIYMAPFYESIRNPTQKDLVMFYQFIQNHVPQFIVDAFYESTVQEDITKAREMIDADPAVYDTLYTPDRYWDVVVDVSTAGFSVQPTRYENGEIAFLDINGAPVSRKGLILPEQWEKESAFTKWLYRRGPLFIDNFEIMLDAYRTSNGPDEFTQRVMQEIHR